VTIAPKSFYATVSSHVDVSRRTTYASSRSGWEAYKGANVKSSGQVTYGECSMLTNILAKSSDAASIPVACRFDEGNNVGRVHSQHSNQTLYNLSRRMTKSFCPEGIAVEHTGLHHNDAPQSGSISFGECQTLATHLHQTFGVTSLLPKSCAELLAKAKGST